MRILSVLLINFFSLSLSADSPTPITHTRNSNWDVYTTLRAEKDQRIFTRVSISKHSSSSGRGCADLKSLECKFNDLTVNYIGDSVGFAVMRFDLNDQLISKTTCDGSDWERIASGRSLEGDCWTITKQICDKVKALNLNDIDRQIERCQKIAVDAKDLQDMLKSEDHKKITANDFRDTIKLMKVITPSRYRTSSMEDIQKKFKSLEVDKLQNGINYLHTLTSVDAECRRFESQRQAQSLGAGGKSSPGTK